MTWLNMFFNNFIEDYRRTAERTLREYQELDIKIEKLSGYSLGNLERLLAAGWTLTPPNKNPSLSELADSTEDTLPDCFGQYYGLNYQPCEDGDAGFCSYCRECQQADPAY